jgi:hypothetical protein
MFSSIINASKLWIGFQTKALGVPRHCAKPTHDSGPAFASPPMRAVIAQAIGVRHAAQSVTRGWNSNEPRKTIRIIRLGNFDVC